MNEFLCAITQRVDRIEAYDEVRDGIDQNWPNFIDSLIPAASCVALPNSDRNPERLIERLKPDLVVFSGGNDLADLDGAKNVSMVRDQSEQAFLKFCMTQRIPVLAVCRGMQLVNRFFGGHIYVAEPESSADHLAQGHQLVFPGLEDKRLEVNSFHKFQIKADDVAEGFNACAFYDDGSVEAIVHQQLPILAIMWHPERPGCDDQVNDLFIGPIIRGFLKRG